MSSLTTFPKPAFRLMARSRLTVTAILREPPEAVLRFVAWYLEQEADRIVLCFENPEDPSIQMLDGVERVECIPCTEDFWRHLGLDPSVRFSKRQNHAMAYAYSTVAAGWVLNVDCDELVYLKGRTLAEELDAQPAHVRALRIVTAERLRSPDSDGLHFRTAMTPMMQRRAYCDSVAGMALKMGLIGHFLGKSATRAGQEGLKMRQHWMLTPQDVPVNDKVISFADGAYLLHFNDHEFRDWCGKLPERMSNRWFQAPVRDLILAALKAEDQEAELRKLYETFYVFDADRLEHLARARARFDLPVDPDEVAVRYFQNRAA